MPESYGPLLVVSDVHLSASRRTYDREKSEAFAALLRTRAAVPGRGMTVVLAGDVFELLVTRSRGEGVGRDLAALDAVALSHPIAIQALGDVLHAGNRVVVIAGNHDAALTRPEVRARFGELLRASAGPAGLGRLEFRDLALHLPGLAYVEHGHMYDPDCRPDAEGRSLGELLAREVLAPFNLRREAADPHTAPLRLLTRIVLRYGVLAPLIVLRFYWTALRALRMAGRGFAAGASMSAAGARHEGIDAALEGRIALLRAAPTLGSRLKTLLRLRLDRSLFAFACWTVAVSWVLQPQPLSAAGWAAAALACLLPLAAALVHPGPSTERRLLDRQSKAARGLADATGVRSIVLGHSHRPAQQSLGDDAVLLNPGGVRFASGRLELGFVVVDAQGEAGCSRAEHRIYAHAVRDELKTLRAAAQATVGLA